MPEPLTQEEIHKQEEVLREERRLVLAALTDRLHQGDQPEETSLRNNMLEGAVDDRASASLLNDEEISELGLELRELRAVESALERIEQGSYGICDSCGLPIGIDRLRAQPSALLCIGCQTEAERRPGQFATDTTRMRL
jgi:DnaK suppressor protein